MNDFFSKEIKEQSLTVYNSFSVINEKRQVKLNSGVNDLIFENISKNLKLDSVILNAKGARLIEKSFNYDELNIDNLLKKSLGQKVKYIKLTDDFKEIIEDVNLLNSSCKDTLIETKNGIKTNTNGEILFNNIPENLFYTPNLCLKVEVVENSNQEVGLTYMTSGISWKSAYIAKIDEDNSLMTLSSSVLVKNASDYDFKEVSLSLVSGDINVSRETVNYMSKSKMMSCEEKTPPLSNNESFSEYHIYNIPYKVSIKPDFLKSFMLFDVENIKFNKKYSFESPMFRRNGTLSFKDLNPSFGISFANTVKNNLGFPFLKGLVKVFKNHGESLLFVGENNVKNVSINEEVSFDLGKAFDIKVEGKASVIHVKNDIFNVTMEIIVKNMKEEDIEILLKQSLPIDCNVEYESHKSFKKNVADFNWSLPVKKQSVEKLVVKFNFKDASKK